MGIKYTGMKQDKCAHVCLSEVQQKDQGLYQNHLRQDHLTKCQVKDMHFEVLAILNKYEQQVVGWLLDLVHQYLKNLLDGLQCIPTNQVPPLGYYKQRVKEKSVFKKVNISRDKIAFNIKRVRSIFLFNMRISKEHKLKRLFI